MKLNFIKKENAPHILHCIRNDESETFFQPSNTQTADFFIAHDLAHYSLETVLGYTTAFYGMLANGRDIDDFGTKHGIPDSRTFTDEAMFAERLANPLLIALKEQKSFHDFYQMIKLTAETTDGMIPEINESQFNEILHKLSELLDDWQKLPIGSTLTLDF